MTPEEQIQRCDYLCFDFAHLFERLMKEHGDWEQGVDPRLQVVVIPQQAILAYRIVLSFIHTDLKNNVWWEKNVPATKAEMRQHSYNQFDIFQKYGHFVMFFSYFESELRRIYRALKPGASNHGNSAFSNIFTSLLSEIDNTEWIPYLVFATDLRNCLHNNGVFYPLSGKNKVHKFMNQKYTLEVEKPVDFVTPDFLFGFYEQFLLLIDTIVSNDKIRAFNYRT
jgi:hypothetical protein